MQSANLTLFDVKSVDQNDSRKLTFKKKVLLGLL